MRLYTWNWSRDDLGNNTWLLRQQPSGRNGSAHRDTQTKTRTLPKKTTYGLWTGTRTHTTRSALGSNNNIACVGHISSGIDKTLSTAAMTSKSAVRHSTQTYACTRSNTKMNKKCSITSHAHFGQWFLPNVQHVKEKHSDSRGFTFGMRTALSSSSSDTSTWWTNKVYNICWTGETEAGN